MNISRHCRRRGNESFGYFRIPLRVGRALRCAPIDNRQFRIGAQRSARPTATCRSTKGVPIAGDYARLAHEVLAVFIRGDDNRSEAKEVKSDLESQVWKSNKLSPGAN